MRTDKTLTSGLAAMLCAASLFTFACGRQAEEPRDSELSTASAEEEARAADETYPAPETPAGVEIREERSVDVPEETQQAEADELDAHQRELDQKEAELEARARRLRDLERREREIAVAEREIERRESQVAEKPARRPQPAQPARPEPRPEPEPEDDVETEEVAEATGAGGSAPGPEEPEPAEEADEIARREETREEERPQPATVPSGTVVAAEFLETLSSESSRPGDTFRARITGDVRQGGRVVIPAGSEVVGEVTEAVPLRKVGGQAKLAVRFTDLVLPHGVSVPIDASFVGQGKSETGRDAATIGGAAAGGAVLGRVINKKDRSRGAVIGAILGAAIGTAIASRTQGEEVNIFEGSVLDLRFDRPVEIPARR